MPILFADFVSVLGAIRAAGLVALVFVFFDPCRNFLWIFGPPFQGTGNAFAAIFGAIFGTGLSAALGDFLRIGRCPSSAIVGMALFVTEVILMIAGVLMRDPASDRACLEAAMPPGKADATYDALARAEDHLPSHR